MVVRTVAKHRYFSGKRAKRSATEYTNYVTYRRGEDREAGGRKFFDDEREDIRGKEVKDRIKVFEQGRGVAMHELVLSPGLNGVEPQEYTRELMSQLEHSKGQELQWVGVAHKGEHNHIHVLIMGKDEDGRPVKINRHDYKDLREWGDRYLEREHQLDRYIEREPSYDKSLDIDKLEDRQRGDELFNSLFGKAEKEKEWSKEQAIEKLAEKEKIQRSNQTYSRFSSLDELKELDRSLMAGTEERVSKKEYGQLKGWIEEKEKYGDDYHEKQDKGKKPDEKDRYKRKGKERGSDTDSYAREFKELNERARQAYNKERSGDLGRRPMGRQQRLFEQRGRKDLLDSHSTYQFNMAEQRLKDAMERDPANRQQYEKELSLLKESHAKELENYLQKPVDLDKLFGWKGQEKDKQVEAGKEKEPGKEQEKRAEKPQEERNEERPDPDKERREREERERQEREARERREREQREQDERGGR